MGRVKTRLARTIGDQNALQIYLELQRITQKNVEILGGGIFRQLFYTDFINFDDNFDNALYEKYVQRGDDLGERMYNAFQQIFENDPDGTALIIGSDCPDLTTEIVETAFQNLKTHDFTLGRAEDGGYYLLGMTSAAFLTAKNLFFDMIWSVDSVADQTLTRIYEAQKTVALLPTLSDVDEEKDLTPALRKILFFE